MESRWKGTDLPSWSIWNFVALGSGTQSHQVLVFPGKVAATHSGILQLWLRTNLNRSNQKTTIPLRRDIEGLRALAIGLVIASHAELPFLRGGFVGVDVFFVLSGYLITSLLMQEISSSGTVNFARFYARRARRLLPAAITMVLVVCSAEAIIMNPVAQFKTLKAALATVLYSSNLYFAHVQVQYFFQRSAITNPLLHTWSLAVEEQFYLIWPLLLLLLARTIKSVTGRSIALTAISLTSFMLCVWLTATNSTLAFFETPARVWEFGAGGLLVFIPERWLGGRRRLWSWLGGIGIIALTAGAELIHASRCFRGMLRRFQWLGRYSFCWQVWALRNHRHLGCCVQDRPS